MTPKILKSFGLVKTGSKGSHNKGDGARHQKKADAKTSSAKLAIPLTSHALKKREMVDLTGYASKKPRTEGAPFEHHSLALTHVGALAFAYVKDAEIKEWQAMSLDESTKACIKASAQLVFHSTHSIGKMISESVRLTQLESENVTLQIRFKEKDSSHQKDIKVKDADISFLNKEIKDQVETLKTLNENFNKQEAEAKEMKARILYSENQEKNGWPNERKKVEDDYFARGFNFYLVGFITNDPDQIFETFGEEAVADMAEYRRENAKAIKERRIELKLEEPMNAPSENNEMVAEA